jgi:hypothetical protein
MFYYTASGKSVKHGYVLDPASPIGGFAVG